MESGNITKLKLSQKISLWYFLSRAILFSARVLPIRLTRKKIHNKSISLKFNSSPKRQEIEINALQIECDDVGTPNKKKTFLAICYLWCNVCMRQGRYSYFVPLRKVLLHGSTVVLLLLWRVYEIARSNFENIHTTCSTRC